MHHTTRMVIDCQSCPVREIRCDDCMVTALGSGRPLEVPLLGIRALIPASALPLDSALPLQAALPLDAAERRAVDMFVRAGLVEEGVAETLRARREPWVEARAVG